MYQSCERTHQHMNLPFSARYRAFNSLLHQTEPLQPASPVLSSWTRAHGQASTHTVYKSARTHTHAHRHAVILAHNNRPQHEHPHTKHLNDTVTHSAGHRRLPQPLSNTHHNTGRTVKAWLQGVAATDGTAAAAAAGQAR